MLPALRPPHKMSREPGLYTVRIPGSRTKKHPQHTQPEIQY